MEIIKKFEIFEGRTLKIYEVNIKESYVLMGINDQKPKKKKLKINSKGLYLEYWNKAYYV